jgi:hypothetical protein
MTENGNQKRPTRSLEVENFSVIRKARLEFGRITVLIGPQASGKSLLCKLAYFLEAEVPIIAAGSLFERNTWDEFLETLKREFVSRFVISGELTPNWFVSYSSKQYLATISRPRDGSGPGVEFSFGEFFRDLYVLFFPHRKPAMMSRAEVAAEIFLAIGWQPNEKQFQTSLFIPSGREFFTDTAKTVTVLGPGLDPITKRFGEQIAWDTRWKLGLLSTGRGVVQDIEQEMIRIAQGAVAIRDSTPVFLAKDGRNLPLSALSSGTAEVLPMLNVLNYVAFHREHFQARATSLSEPSPGVSIYLEEPEAHVFPETQRDLINLFAWMANDPILSFDWVITTHSPYILTAFNTLIEAWRAAKKTGKRDQVAAIVPEHSWINEDDFAAYAIEDGVLRPIFEKETGGVEGSGLINGDYLDKVSESTSNQFSRLLEIEFADAT